VCDNDRCCFVLDGRIKHFSWVHDALIDGADTDDMGIYDPAGAVKGDGDEVFSRSSSTSLMARRCEQIAQWLQKHNPVPDMTTVLTGTDIVPPPEFTLQQDDVVVISIDVIGELENRVTVV